MSWWLRTQEKNGRRALWSIDVNLPALMVALGLIVALIGPAALDGPEPLIRTLVLLILLISVGNLVYRLVKKMLS